MERNRESRRGTAATSGNFSSSRRRSRGSVFRESHGVSEAEDAGNDPLSRDRSNGKDRSTRRRRLSSSNDRFRVDQDDVADGSSDESLDEENYEEEEMVRNCGNSSRQASKGKSQWKGSDEVIGVSVPRKARSASAKRLQDSFSAVGQSSSSSPARTSAASVSPPSSNASMKAGKRMKHVTLKTKPLKTPKVSISESEVELAQVLYGLTKLQSHPSPPKPEIFQASQKFDLKSNSSNEGLVSVASKVSSPLSSPVSPPSSQPLVLPQHSSPMSASTVMAPKRKKPRPTQLEDNNNSISMITCSSKPSGSTNAGNPTSFTAAAPVKKSEGEKDSQNTKVEVLSPEGEKNAAFSNSDSSKPDSSLPVSSPCQKSMSRDIHPDDKPSSLNTVEAKDKPSSFTVDAKIILSPDCRLPLGVVSITAEQRHLDTDCKASVNPNHETTQKETSSSSQDFPVPDAKLDASKICSAVSTVVEGVRGERIEIDLMAPPENSCPDDCMPDAIERGAPPASDYEDRQVIDETITKCKGVTNVAEKLEMEEARAKQEYSLLESEVKIRPAEAVGVVTSGKQSVNERKSESNNAGNNLDKAGYKQQHSQKLPKSAARPAERSVPPIGVINTASTPTPMMIPGWPGGLSPPFGYNPSGVPSVRGAMPLEGNAAIPNASVVMLSQPRPNRCATHLLIAHRIHYQQQMARLNPFWAAAAAGSAALYGAKPYNMNMLPQSDVLLFGSSAIQNPNATPNPNLGSGSVVTLNGHNSMEKASISLADAQRKQPMHPQSVQQGSAFIFPVSQSRAGETKPSNFAEGTGLLSASGAVASANTKFSNIAAAAASDPQYLAMLHNNYPFPIPPPYRAHINQQQLQPAGAPFFAGSFYPSQLLQLQSHSLPQTQNPTNSAGSLTSQKQHIRKHSFAASKPLETRNSELEPAKNGEDGTDSQTSLAQKKKLQAQNFPSNPSFNPNFPQNFPIGATGLGGKQPHQLGDSGIQMSMKGVEVGRLVPPGHAMLQAFPDVGNNHYQLGNLSKAPVKSPVARNGDKSTETSKPPAVGVAVQQQQVMARAKPAVSATSTAVSSGAMAYTDRMPVPYTSVNFPAGPMGFPNMQNPLQWKMQPSQRVVQAGPPGNAIAQSPAEAVATSNAGSSADKVAKLTPTPLNSNQKVITAGLSVPASQAQSMGKTQQLYFSNSDPVQQSGGAALSQKLHAEPNSMAQAVFPGSLNMRRPPNQQGQSVLTGAGAGNYLVGGGKGATVYSPLVGGPIAAITGVSYGKSATTLPAKSTEQKPATA